MLDHPPIIKQAKEIKDLKQINSNLRVRLKSNLFSYIFVGVDNKK